MTAPIRLVLVDDHPVVRAGYARLVEQARDVRVLAEAGSAEEALECLDRGLTPDVVVTDLSMPAGLYGIELIGRVRARLPGCRVIVFSMYDSPALVRRSMQAGAAGFLTKSSAPQLLVQAIRSVHAGGVVLSPGLDGAAVPSGTVDDRARLATLTEREFIVFRLLAEGHAIAECAKRLQLSPKTASNYQTILRDKLGVSTSAALARLAMRCGIVEPLHGGSLPLEI